MIVELNGDPTVRKLLTAFMKFQRMNWALSRNPIGGFKPSEAVLMRCIKAAVKPGTPGVRVQELSQMMRITSPSVTPLIKSLEEGGYIERKMDREDRRAVRITLTEKGEEAVCTLNEVIRAAFSGLAEHLGEEDSDRLADLLVKVVAYWTQESEQGPDETDRSGVDPLC